MPEEAFVALTKGSRYRIQSVETRDKPMVSHGVFRGYAAVGPDDAVCIELDESHRELKGKVRLIPCHMVISIDVSPTGMRYSRGRMGWKRPVEVRGREWDRIRRRAAATRCGLWCAACASSRASSEHASRCG